MYIHTYTCIFMHMYIYTYIFIYLQVINIGHLYKVREGESVHELIRKFGTSIKDTMFVNVDLSRQTETSWSSHLPVGKNLCLVPNSCGTHV